MLEGYAILDGPELGDAGAARVVDPARGRRGDGPRPARPATRHWPTSRCPASASVAGLVERPEGGHEAWFGYTDHDDAVVGLPLRRAHRRDVAVGDRAGHGRRAARSRPAGRRTRRPTAPTVRMFVHRRRPRSPDRPPPDDPLRLRRLRHAADAGLLRRRARLGRGRRRLRRRQPARRRRGGRGVAPRRHARPQAERLRRLPRRRRVARRRRLDDHRTSWRSTAAPTAGCWSAPR